jgi:hypothetical protein
MIIGSIMRISLLERRSLERSERIVFWIDKEDKDKHREFASGENQALPTSSAACQLAGSRHKVEGDIFYFLLLYVV